MSWRAIAKAEFRDGIRSKTLSMMTVLFTFIILLGSARGVTMLWIETVLLPILVVVLSSIAITGGRESGRLRYVLGLPVTRLELLAGTFVGRAAAIALAVGIALFVGATVIGVRFFVGSAVISEQFVIVLVEFAVYALLMLCFTILWVGIGVGVSAASSTRGRALFGAFGLYCLFLYTGPFYFDDRF